MSIFVAINTIQLPNGLIFGPRTIFEVSDDVALPLVEAKAARFATQAEIDGIPPVVVPTLSSKPSAAIFDTRAEAIAARNVANSVIGVAHPLGTLWFSRDSKGTALVQSDGTKWSPDGVVLHPEHWGDLPADGDWHANFVAIATWMRSRPGTTLDGRGRAYQLSKTFKPVGFEKRTWQNLTFKPHRTWVSRWPGDDNSIWSISSATTTVVRYGAVPGAGQIASPNPADYAEYPMVNLAVGVGDFRITNVTFDGRDANGLPVADGILYTGGANIISFCRAIYFPNFGIWVGGGTDGIVEQNKVSQWQFNDAENGQKAKRTAAGLVLGTGDITWTNNVSCYSRYPLVVYATGASQLKFDHYYNGANSGDVLTSGKTYNRLVYNGCFPVFEGCYCDKGISRFEEMRVQDRNPRFLTAGNAVFDPFFYELVPLEPNTPLNGLMIIGADFQGSKTGNDDTLLSTDFFRVDSWGANTFVGISNHLVVANNTYHSGTGSGSDVPSTSDAIRFAVPTTKWVAANGAYKSGIIDLADKMFLPTAVDYVIFYAVENNAGAAPYPMPAIRMQRINPYQVQFWTDTVPTIALKIGVTWHPTIETI